MAIGSLAGVIPRLRGVALVSHGTLSDAELLDRFISRRDEVAFEVMVRRHGPMVFAVCRRVLRQVQDAEDAFQATFLVLAHKAATVLPRNKLAGWLHGVAHRSALKARHRAARRLEVEKKVPARGQDEMQPETNWDEVEPLLDQELTGLPERYRLPIILCDLEGRLRTEVAASLGCSEGTLSSRLTRGRRLLAERLKRRGVRLSGAAIALLLSERANLLAEPLIRATVPAALSAVSASSAVSFAVSPNVAALATGVMKSMFLKKLQTVAVATFVAFAFAAFAALALTGLVAHRSVAAPVPTGAPVPEVKGGDELPPDLNGRLLMNRKVIKDLKCDMEQFDKIMDLLEDADKKAAQKATEAMGQLRNNGGNINPAAIEQMFKDAQEEGEKEFRKVVSVATGTLTPAQRKRLREIDLQARGPAAFAMPTVAKALDLSPKQKEQMEANVKQAEDDTAQATQRQIPVGGAGVVKLNGAAGGGNVVVNGVAQFDSEKVAQDARAEGMKRAMAVLTEEQTATWKKLVGEPFTHPLGNLKGPRSGGGMFRIGGGGFVPGVQIAPAVPAVPAQVIPVQGVPIKP